MDIQLFIIKIDALSKEGKDSKNRIIDKIVKRSVAVCPKLEFFRETCQLESLRVYGSSVEEANFEAMCSTNCTPQPLSSLLCHDAAYPAEVWNNNFNSGRSFEEKVCCSVGAEPRISKTFMDDEYDAQVEALTCSEPPSKVGLVVGLSVGGAVVMIFLFIWVRRKKA